MSSFNYREGSNPSGDILGLSSRILLSCAVLILVILCTPQKAHSLKPIDPRDPYIRTILTLDVDFNYDRSTYQQEGSDVNASSNFNQDYDFVLSGNIIDPRLFIYKSFFSYSRSTNSGNTSNSGMSMGINTTLLRKLRFPINLYANRSISNDQTSDTYGANMFFDFRRLPATKVSAIMHRTMTDISTIMNSAYTVRMAKRIGPTNNRLNYSLNISDDSSSRHNFNLINTTRFSSATRFNFVLSKFITNVADSEGDNDGTGLTMELDSSPGISFSQKHSYALFKNNSDNTSVLGQSYSGSWGYTLFRSIGVGFGLHASESKFDSETSKSESSGFGTNASMGYSINKNLSFSLASTYNKFESSFTEVLTEDQGLESFDITASLAYLKRIRNMVFSSSYQAGYIEELSLPDRGGGTGLSQGIGVSLSNVYIRYFIINNSYNYNRVDTLSGNLWEVNQRLNTSLQPTFWGKYVTMGAHYGYAQHETWKSVSDSKSQSFSYSASTSIFRRVSLSGSQNYSTSTFDYSNEEINTRSVSSSLNASYGMRIFRGHASMSLGLSHSKSDTDGATNSILNTNFNLGYARPLLRRINWKFNLSANQHEDLDDNSISKGTSFNNLFTYSLRAWLMQATYSYLIRESSVTAQTRESRFVFSISRRFTRVLR